MSEDEDWSDSDSEAGSEVETSVLLGVPDGFIETPSDAKDAAVSRIGGVPALLPSPEPSFESSHCTHCQSPMELLVQMWCPFEDSPYDRALYIWGCAMSACQRKEGSVRAWRGLRFNARFAEKLERKLAAKKEKEKEKAAALAKSKETKTNPFSLNSSNASNPFGLGSNIFGSIPSSEPVAEPASTADAQDNEDKEDASDAESTSSASSLIVAMASTALSDSPWLSAPSYPPQYLSTVSEYIPPIKKPKVSAQSSGDVEGDGHKQDAWASEKYENSMEIDQVFDKFSKRLSIEAEQCVRYDLGGTPLPFSKDAVFNKLFPSPTEDPSITIVTKSEFKVQPSAQRTYDAKTIPPCAHCGSKRVFECQLMPNLINVLRDVDRAAEEAKQKKMSDDERRQEVERLLKGGMPSGGRGMEWGTIMVFSCERDCCESRKDGWKEERVLVQWEDASLI